MTKQVSSKIPDQLAEDLKRYPWINWAGFIRESLETQVNLLKKGDTRMIFEFVLAGNGSESVE